VLIVSRHVAKLASCLCAKKYPTEESRRWSEGGGEREQATAEQYTYIGALWLESVYLGRVSLV
jgi:hypothetical protein